MDAFPSWARIAYLTVFPLFLLRLFRLPSFQFYVHLGLFFCFLFLLLFTYFFSFFFFPFLSFLLFHIGLFRRFLNYTVTSPPVRLYLGLVTRYYIPPIVFSVTILLFQSSNHLRSFPRPSFHVIMFLSFSALHVAILPCSSAGTRHLLPLIFVCNLYLLLLLTDFNLFVICSCFSSLFLFQNVPVFYSKVCFHCLPALHVFFLKWSKVGLQLSPLSLFCLELPIY